MRNDLQITIKALRDCTIPETELNNELFESVSFKTGETTNYYNCAGFEIVPEHNTDDTFIILYFYNDITKTEEYVPLNTKDFTITRCA